MSKTELLERGVFLAEEFCRANSVPIPELRTKKRENWSFDACAYYRPTYIAICAPKCAQLGFGGRSWSWPGYIVDRTPYGVVQHELGHHVDYRLSDRKGSYFGDFSIKLREETKEDAITGYCPNTAEWFAEMFRLFVTNPNLLRELRPKTWFQLSARFTPVVGEPWREVLKAAPARTIAAAENRLRKEAV